MADITKRQESILSCGHCTEYEQVSRREFLVGSLSTAGFIFGKHVVPMPSWMPLVGLADPHIGPPGDTLVCIFLRGGADGLNMIVPHGDESYYRLRPTIGISRPDDGSAESRVVDLDGFFGLHPTLERLMGVYDQADLAFVHASGSPDETRSHFEAMALMEQGVAPGAYSGWLTRHLATLNTGNTSALRAVGIGELLPASLVGAYSATALRSIADYHLQGRHEQVGQMQELLQILYGESEDLLSAAAEQTFATLEILGKLNLDSYSPAGQPYPENDFGQAMQTVAQLIKAEVGVEVACVDAGGWDTHIAQGGSTGQMANLLSTLGQGLRAFYEDLQEQMGGITVVVMSEFGRRVKENGGLGTDHGHGNMMMIMGGGIDGGQVFARWPGLEEEQLVGPGDLAMTTDYRDVLAEIIRNRLGNPRLEEVFPDYTVNEIGLTIPRTGLA